MITFEQFLMEKHCETNPELLDDMLVDDFNDWVSERLDINELIKYGDEFAKLKDKEWREKIEQTLKPLNPMDCEMGEKEHFFNTLLKKKREALLKPTK